MKQIFKKNQIIITALALMLCAAGYLQFSGAEPQNVAEDSTGQNPLYTVAEDGASEDGSITIKVDTAKTTVDASGATVPETVATTSGENTDGEEEENHKIGEAVMVSTTLQTNFTSNARLVREQRRAQSKETLMGIIDSTSISEEQKQIAVETLVNLTTIAEKESAAELLLEAKGFADPIVNIVEDQVDVVINAESVTDQQIAQIEDIVTRKTGFEPSDIKITAAIQED